ncbi:hypothetical protein [Ostreibacterium oceani]|uniref:Type IV pilus assembly protein PilF n=1 Tax=Ostreibacterium oceani TaxID=2654998 RepID=A0A6N7F1W4_9GAMM|nr:hypothetical protein [Ostreibacterium oceani]MPV85856.1 hypothetical protein [Ostreibacterium oceani]
MKVTTKLIAASVLAVQFLLAGCITSVDGDEPPEPKPEAAAQSHFELGIQYIQRERYDLAEHRLQRSIELFPMPEAYNALALVYEEVRQNLLAEEVYEKMIAEFPDFGRGYMNYSIFLCKYDRKDQIKSLIDRMLASDRTLAALGEISAAECYRANGDEAQAIVHYQRALEYEPYSAGALLPLAEIDISKGFIPEAKQKVDTVNNQIGYSARSVYLSILIAQELGNQLELRNLMRVMQTRYAGTEEAKILFGGA